MKKLLILATSTLFTQQSFALDSTMLRCDPVKVNGSFDYVTLQWMEEGQVEFIEYCPANADCITAGKYMAIGTTNPITGGLPLTIRWDNNSQVNGNYGILTLHTLSTGEEIIYTGTYKKIFLDHPLYEIVENIKCKSMF